MKTGSAEGPVRYELGVLGCGRMAGAMVSRWLSTGAFAAEQIIAANATATEADEVHNRLGVVTTDCADDVIDGAGIVLLGIKPQQIDVVLPGVAARIPAGQLWVSMLAGVPLERLRALVGPAPRLIRIMPNQPARLGLGMTAMAAGPTVPQADRAKIRALLAQLGEVAELDEAQIDDFTAIAGSGPAYVFLFLEALTEAAEAIGFDTATARRLALQTVRGASALAAESAADPAALRRDVTSPGGTTEAAIATFEAHGWRQVVALAAQAAVRRAAQLAGTQVQAGTSDGTDVRDR